MTSVPVLVARRWLVLVLVVLIVAGLLVAACGGGDGKPTGSACPRAGDAVTGKLPDACAQAAIGYECDDGSELRTFGDKPNALMGRTGGRWELRYVGGEDRMSEALYGQCKP